MDMDVIYPPDIQPRNNSRPQRAKMTIPHLWGRGALRTFKPSLEEQLKETEVVDGIIMLGKWKMKSWDENKKGQQWQTRIKVQTCLFSPEWNRWLLNDKPQFAATLI